jgi:molybdopterin-guanine dinucleotide biosynthesis protein A
LIGAILAGGENTRIPVLKGFLTVKGRTIIERSLDTLRSVFGRVVINTNMPEKYFCFGVPLIGDITKESGPITGILSILANIKDDSAFVVACDMPFISEKLIRYMVDYYKGHGASRLRRPAEVGGKGQVDAVIPLFNGMPEPLFGIYTRDVITTVEDAISKGEKGIHEMLKRLDVLYINDEEVRDLDPDGSSFVNINTMEDYEKLGGRTCLV